MAFPNQSSAQIVPEQVADRIVKGDCKTATIRCVLKALRKTYIPHYGNAAEAAFKTK